MRANRTLEIGTGLFVLLGFAALFFLTTQLPSSGIKLGSAKHSYHVIAEFDNIGDLKVGSPVTMAGVRIGEVDSIRFDPKSYKAVVGMRIDKQYNEIPDDSFASIQTQGLLGGKYIGFSPGGSDTYFKDGSRVDQTQSAIVLESLINKLFAGFADKGGGAQGNGQNSASQSDTNSQQGTKK
ncbi:MAG TPA: outer membrane lipid asymmetry maintenance protein MlaD [Steroidobacteraceae bacterium]|jgi:phospholipid/cholesterol/gamma-HCH transport system substrate-binding protein|nr:outer membrane lipid asymmetry maintenance protein MlaD [Steroidobacteraceae bacterium]